jgi:hypothetical protein
MSMTLTEGFLQWVPDEADWERMQRLGDASSRMNLSLDYAAFRAWNTTCYEGLSDQERAFVAQLLTSVIGERVRLLDLETCAFQPANLVMFDKDKALVIVSNR